MHDINISLVLQHSISFVPVLQDIDSERPMMQVGQYVFAGEYEGKKSFVFSGNRRKENACFCAVVKEVKCWKSSIH